MKGTAGQPWLCQRALQPFSKGLPALLPPNQVHCSSFCQPFCTICTHFQGNYIRTFLQSITCVTYAEHLHGWVQAMVHGAMHLQTAPMASLNLLQLLRTSIRQCLSPALGTSLGELAILALLYLSPVFSFLPTCK